MKILILLALTFSFIFAYAGITENQVDIKLEANQISLTPKPGFHLNKEAPASAVIDDLESLNRPQTKTEKLFVFKKEEKSKKAVLSFYVCDDKKTVCEKHDQTLNLKTGNAKKTPIKTSYNNIKELNVKSNNGKPTLLVFSAPWCPACVRMMTETYHQPMVKRQLAKVNFIKLNSDLPEVNELSEKFHVKAIPTLILLDKDGNESYRWLDFQKAQNFSKSLDAELKKVNSVTTTIANAKLGDAAAASALGHNAYNALDFAEAYKWFSLTTSEKDLKYKLASEVSLAQGKADDDEKLTTVYLNTLEKNIILTPSKLDKIRWSLDLYDKKNENKSFTEETKEKATGLISEIDGLIKNIRSASVAFTESTYGDYSGFEKEELLWMKAKLAGIVGDKKLEEETKKQSVSVISAKALSVDRPGELLLAIAYLREAGDVATVENHYKNLIQEYPNSYVYFEKYARFSQKNKNLDKALDLVTEALKFPEGNTPQLGLLKTQILIDLKKKDEALSTIDQTLQTQGLDHKRYAKTVKKLNDLKAELGNQTNIKK